MVTATAQAAAKAQAAVPPTPTPSGYSSNYTPILTTGLRQKLDLVKEKNIKDTGWNEAARIGAAVTPKSIGQVTASVGAGLPVATDSSPSIRPERITIGLVTPTPSPKITPTPSPKPTPTLTPRPTANLNMISQFVADKRNLKNPFYMKYSQLSGDRSDCSTQATDFYAIKGENSPFYGIAKDTCRSYYEVYRTLPSSFIESGGTVLSTVHRDNEKGVARVPANWQEKAEFGDIAIWMENPKYDKDGRLIVNRPDAAWHMAICTGDAEMIDRAQWKENNPNGFEEGLFVRGLDTLKSSYKLIMIISPSDEARLTPDDIYYYLLDQQ